MNRLTLLQQRLVQALHDPPHKSLILNSGIKHTEEARKLAQALIDEPLAGYNRAPDLLASGADRAVVGPASAARVDWRKRPIITHPLQPGVQMEAAFEQMPVGQGAQARIQAITQNLCEYYQQDDAAGDSGTGDTNSARTASGDADETESVPRAWNDPEQLLRARLLLWRQMDAVTREIGVPAAWLPADSRSPDHSIDAHLRMATAAAFMEPPARKGRRPERQIWLLQMGVRGVQKFIAESRKTRDLWTSCMIFSELVWAAMAVVVDTYGPEAILYPDIHGNPLMDQWLLRNSMAGAVPDAIRQTGAPTYAAPIPNTFMALVPAGGAGDLPKLEDLAQQCETAVHMRWQELADSVHDFVQRKMGKGAWQGVWKRQFATQHAPDFVWSAVRWRRRLRGIEPRPLDLKKLPGQPEESAFAILRERERALAPWMPRTLWNHYEQARDASWAVDTAFGRRYHSAERGFDYALVHHQLRRSYQLRKLAETPVSTEEPGEKCCLTGRHEVLSNQPATSSPQPAHRTRQAGRDFWSRLGLEDGGEERLGGPGTLKRFLAYVPPRIFRGTDNEPFPERWAGINHAPADPRVPFPSTAGVAASRFLVALAKTDDPALRADRDQFVKHIAATETLRESVHLQAHPRLSGVDPDSESGRFVQVEAEYLHVDALESLITRHKKRGEQEEAERIEKVKKAASRLWKRTRGEKPLLPPLGTGVGILAMDGDGMSRLLDGDPAVIQTTWRDVLHPDVPPQFAGWRDSTEASDRRRAAAEAWNGILDKPRHMGPALHAAITRSLATFVHEIVAWVVEGEFHGRLIYAGGDDLLAMLPATDLIGAATRLQQLFSAPFIIDTAPKITPWSWRTGNHALSDSGKKERQRFLIPEVPSRDPNDTRQVTPISLANCTWEPHAATGEPAQPPAELRLDRIHIIPMLGRAHSMSAGIAFGHYKTPLGRMIREARYNLDEVAKKRPHAETQHNPDGTAEEPRKAAIAITRFTRSGAKGRFCAGWEVGSDGSDPAPTWQPDPPAIGHCFRTAVQAFATGTLSARLPYKLWETIKIVGPEILTQEKDTRKEFVLGWLTRSGQLDGEPLKPIREACLALINAGIEYAGSLQSTPKKQQYAIVAGLLLARHLAAEQTVESDAGGANHDG